MSGTIAYCAREDHTYPLFAAALARLAQRHPDAQIVSMIGNDIADSRNKAVLQAGGDWIWFIDTDMLFAPETVDRLLAHDVDVVQVLCLKRHPPHEPIVWESSAVHLNHAPDGTPRLVEVQSLGAGGTLYRRCVFESIPGPWFEGVLGREDTCFAQKVKAAGVRLYVDLATPVGHTTPIVVWPHYDLASGQWLVRYDAMNGHSVMLPAVDTPVLIRG
jgi:glycosyltransferase involved in cell wall biosynthesis